MASLSFSKIHGAGNDFLIIERSVLAKAGIRRDQVPRVATEVCSRRFGVGADGIEIVEGSKVPGVLASAHLWNSDGSEAEISGNGTRCVAAFLTERRQAGPSFALETGAGVRRVSRVRASHPDYAFRMSAGDDACHVVEPAVRLKAAGTWHTVTTVDVGNPQCVCKVASFDFEWTAVGAALERHPHFPNRSNVSFVRFPDPGTDTGLLEVRFWERGAGATLSSGTGALGAALASWSWGWTGPEVKIRTQGGELTVDRREGIGLTGPARIVAWGHYETG